MIAAVGYGYVETYGRPEEPPLSEDALLAIRVAGYGFAFAALAFLSRLRDAIDRSPGLDVSDPRKLMQCYLRSAIVVVGIADLPALVGFVLAVLGGDDFDALGLGVASLVLLGIHFPPYHARRLRIEQYHRG